MAHASAESAYGLMSAGGSVALVTIICGFFLAGLIGLADFVLGWVGAPAASVPMGQRVTAAAFALVAFGAAAAFMMASEVLGFVAHQDAVGFQTGGGDALGGLAVGLGLSALGCLVALVALVLTWRGRKPA